MKNFRNNSWAFLLMVSFLICVSFVDHSGSGYKYDYTSIADTTKQPRMTVEEITVQPMIVLAIKDTAATTAEIGPKLGKNYGTIGAFMGQNNLQMTGAPLAWYYSEKEPFILEAGIPVNQKPSATHPSITVKEIPAAKAVVVHFWGPYELTPQAYDKIREWLKKNNKKAQGAPFDVYLTDPTTVNDPYQVQTDIIQIYQ
ncbi:MAG TPA: GyrI-like domain-containing protein [Chitinophagaceae bacterium]|nr:GyrI-like domain-containing protein [Chitinophagaceae bacterium]